MQKSRIEIKCPARLHLCLFSMNTEMHRVNGGIGFCINAPNIFVVAEESVKFEISDKRSKGLNQLGKINLIKALKNAAIKHGLRKNISIEISGLADIHSGFGTGTTIYLACLEALMLINGCTLTEIELIQASGRGGTSGIGIRTYFSGGLVIDLGHKNNGQKPQPSAQNGLGAAIPLLLQRTTMPDWSIGICIPSHIQTLSNEDENIFFQNTCPVPENECHRAFYHGVSGVLAAAQECDQVAFQNSIRELQKCEWKKAERTQYGAKLHNLENTLYSMGATAVGMSSLGPSLFFLADEMDPTIQQMQKALPDCKFMHCQPNNSGRKIRWLN